MSAAPVAPTHIDLYDKAARTNFASSLNVTDDQLRKAVRVVGTRISTLSSYLQKHR